MKAVQGKAYDAMRTAHVKEHQRLFRRVALSLPATANSGLPTDERLKAFDGTNDPALADIERLRVEFPQVPIRIVGTSNDAPNGKVGSLEILAREAVGNTALGFSRAEIEFLGGLASNAAQSLAGAQLELAHAALATLAKLHETSK